MEQLNIYKVQGKNMGLEFVFKYDLNGVLVEFKKNHALTDDQRLWLYSPCFPETETLMEQWISHPSMRKKFIVIKTPTDLSFDAFWKIWDLKVKKEGSEKAWNKLNEEAIIKCFLNHKNYQNHLIKTGQAKAHLVTWLNQKRYNDEY